MNTNKGNKKRLLAAGIVTAILLGGAGAAFAYWTVTGAGTGTAATGDGAEAVVIHSVALTTPLAPGLAPQNIQVTIDNANDGPVVVTSVTATVTGVDSASELAGCDYLDYAIAGTPATLNQSVPVGLGNGPYTTGQTIELTNTASNQDACKGATVSLSFTSD
jgi:hypothetical protein